MSVRGETEVQLMGDTKDWCPKGHETLSSESWQKAFPRHSGAGQLTDKVPQCPPVTLLTLAPPHLG